MAVTKTVLKNTHQEAVVKVAGTSGTATISLDTDLLLSAAQALDGSTQTVNIIGISWTGATGSTISIQRNSVVVASLLGETAAQFEFDGQQMVPDTIQNTKNIDVVIGAAQAECWLKLRKVSGYVSKSGEYPQYGAYEDETRVGASTTISGSPDYAG